ncbi:hypothetical protein [Sphaerothrix gracilis]
MNTALIDGLQVVLVVSVASVVLIPIFCWVLPERVGSNSSAEVA